MIPEQEIKGIRTMLEKAENPIYLFDDDQDGLCSFLVLWKITKKGKGIPSKGLLNRDSAEKVKKERADLLILLDKPVVEQEFLDEIRIPIIHIDHHPPLKIKAPNYHYYNPRKENDKDTRPTSYWAYQVAKDNLWIATIGIISDWYIPEFITEFQEKYPGLLPEVKNPGQALFETDFGKLCRSFAFALKGKSTERNQCLKVLTRIDDPWEIMRQETAKGKFIFKHFEKMEKRYQKIREQAMKVKVKGEIFLFTYPSSEDSFTSLLSNEVVYRHPEKVVIIGRVKEDAVVMSLRSTKHKLPDIITRALEGLEGHGGGHDAACGANVRADQFGTFMERFEEIIKEKKK